MGDIKVSMYGNRNADGSVTFELDTPSFQTTVPPNLSHQDMVNHVKEDYGFFVEATACVFVGGDRQQIIDYYSQAPRPVKTCCGGCGSGCSSNKPILVEFELDVPTDD